MDQKLVLNILAEILTSLSLPFSDIVISEDDGFVRFNINSSTPSRIIGWHGETLNALQNILKSIVRTKLKLERSPYLLLDVDGYRGIQEEKVITIAKRKAEFVRKSGKRVALPPMSPYFRRIIHMFIASDPEYKDLITESMGEGEYRQIVLRLKEGQENMSDEEQVPVAEEEQHEWGNLEI